MTKQRVILLAIILVAFLLRVWQLPQTPPGLWYDEAYNAMDALWMAETGNYSVFFLGNNGREPMWHYLVLLSTWFLGNTAFAVRWVGSLSGLLTIPIMYRFALALARPFVSSMPGRHHRRWFALAATGWLAVSWWHLLNSRAGFRPVLLPPLLMLSLYFFWRGAGEQGSRGAGEQGSRGAEEQGSRGAGEQGSVTSFTGAGAQAVGKRKSRITHYALRITHHVPRFSPFILAGFFLGLAQYTYLPARLAPLIFGGLAVLWTLKLNRNSVKRFWLGVFITAVVAAIIFIPLGLFFLNTPEAFSSRTGDVIFAPDGVWEGVAHLLQGMTFFFGAGHELYRHHLPGRAMLGWLEIPFFWVGLIFLLRPSHLRRPETQLILLGLGVMWLPALLASPPVHSLRPIGLMPFYYLIVTIGLYQVAGFTHHALRITHHASRIPSHITPHLFPLAAAAFITLTGLINSYDYFWRWANHPEVYKEFNGPLVDLTHHLLNLTQTRDVIIPFHVYAHPTTRYLLRHAFTETDGALPTSNAERPVEMLIIPDVFQLLYVGNIPQSPALVLLTRDETGRGLVYVSRPPRAAEQVEINQLLASVQTQLTPFQDNLGRDVGLFAPLQPIQNPKSKIQNLFNRDPLRTINLTWTDLVELKGYDVTPQVARPGQSIMLNLYWRSLTDDTFEQRLFLQLVDRAGNPINQLEDDAFREDMYRWRPNGILPTQHTLWLGPDTPPGPYLMRLGFFDPFTGRRLPLRMGEFANGESANGEIRAAADQAHLGLFYVSSGDADPRLPATPLSAAFGDSIKLIGITLPDIQKSKIQNPKSKIEVVFHWQTLRPTDKPYTVFLQLLNKQGEVISSWDSQPFNGLYPTTRWSPGEVVVDTFLLPLPEAGLPPGPYRLVTGFYDFDTGRRLPVAGGGDFAELGQFVVE